MLVKETHLGKIYYRLPNIAEGPRLMAMCGINSKTSSNLEWLEQNELNIIATIIENMGKYIEKIEIVKDNIAVESYNDLLNVHELREDIYEIANRVIESLSGKKKED